MKNRTKLDLKRHSILELSPRQLRATSGGYRQAQLPPSLMPTGPCAPFPGDPESPTDPILWL
jgi:hypothetical protein